MFFDKLRGERPMFCNNGGGGSVGETFKRYGGGFNNLWQNTVNPRDAFDVLDPLSAFNPDKSRSALNGVTDGQGGVSKDQIQVTGEQTAQVAAVSGPAGELRNASDEYVKYAEDLDRTTSGEIETLLDNKNASGAAKLLAAAKKGTGVYAVRKINENQKKLIQMRPGRAQVSQRYSLLS